MSTPADEAGEESEAVETGQVSGDDDSEDGEDRPDGPLARSQDSLEDAKGAAKDALSDRADEELDFPDAGQGPGSTDSAIPRPN